jgi:nicotinate-nucleotide adenylyltransferase
MPTLDISSSMIRRLIREGREIRYLVPGPVARYIAEHGLYRK